MAPLLEFLTLPLCCLMCRYAPAGESIFSLSEGQRLADTPLRMSAAQAARLAKATAAQQAMVESPTLFGYRRAGQGLLGGGPLWTYCLPSSKGALQFWGVVSALFAGALTAWL